MEKTLYVGNLPYTTTKEKLEGLFAQHGKVVSVTLIENPYTHRLKGFGFVVMATEKEAEDAKTALNGTELEGRKISVSDARRQGDAQMQRERPRFPRRERFKRPERRGRSPFPKRRF